MLGSVSPPKHQDHSERALAAANAQVRQLFKFAEMKEKNPDAFLPEDVLQVGPHAFEALCSKRCDRMQQAQPHCCAWWTNIFNETYHTT
jgi:hypothetical protein